MKTGQAGLATLHGAGQGRARRRHLAGHLVRARRRAGLDDRRLRSRDRHLVLDHRQSRPRLGRRRAARRQPLLRLAARARSEDRRDEVVLPVHAARRLGLRRKHPALPGRHEVRRRAAQARRAGQPERLLLHPRPHQREVPARDAVPRAGELGDDRRQRPAGREPGRDAEGRCEVPHLPEQPRRHERLVHRRAEPGPRARVHSVVGSLPGVHEGDRRVPGRPAVPRAVCPTRSTRPRARRTGTWPRSRSRPAR